MIYKFRIPEQNEDIVIAGDPAEGHDYSAFIVLSKKYADVLMLGRSKEESSQLGYTLNHMGLYIKKHTNNFPTIAVERNVGSATLYVLKQLNYTNLFRMPNSFTTQYEEKTENYGWVTSSSTRPKMLDDLALAIRQRSIKIPSKILVDELFTFVRHEKTGKPQAEIGCHDDLVMALAIAWQMYSIVPGKQPDYVVPVNDLSNANWSLDDRPNYHQTNLPKNPFDEMRIGE
jgi:hypothetical protein